MSELLKCIVGKCPKCKQKFLLKQTGTLISDTLLFYDTNLWGIVKYKKYEGNCCGKKLIKREKEIISQYYK